MLLSLSTGLFAVEFNATHISFNDGLKTKISEISNVMGDKFNYIDQIELKSGQIYYGSEVESLHNQSQDGSTASIYSSGFDGFSMRSLRSSGDGSGGG